MYYELLHFYNTHTHTHTHTQSLSGYSNIIVITYSNAQHSNEPVAAQGEPQGEDMTHTTTEEDTSCRSNSTIEPAAEPTESAAVTNDNKPSPTGNDKNDNDQIQNDPPADDAAQPDSKVCICVCVCMYM